MVGIKVEGDVETVADQLAAMDEVDYVVITAGSYDLLVEVVCEDDEHLLEVVNRRIRALPGVRDHRDLRLPEAPQADLHLGNPMTTSPQYVSEPGDDTLADSARDHLWMHFTRHSSYENGAHVPIIVRGEGTYIWDDQGKRYLDGLAGLFVVQAGHGRTELAEAAAQAGGRARLLPALVLRAPEGDRARRAARRPTPPATSTGSSSPPAAARPSRPPGSSPSSTSSSPASR